MPDKTHQLSLRIGDELLGELTRAHEEIVGRLPKGAQDHAFSSTIRQLLALGLRVRHIATA